jgi:hypothetical protein
MKNIKDYKKRFYNLLESTVGNVKPLLESTEPTINKDTATEMERISEFVRLFKGERLNFYLPEQFDLPLLQIECENVMFSERANHIYITGIGYKTMAEGDLRIGQVQLTYMCDGSNIFELKVTKEDGNILQQLGRFFVDFVKNKYNDSWRRLIAYHAKIKNRNTQVNDRELANIISADADNLLDRFPQPRVEGGTDDKGVDMIKYVQDFLCSYNKEGNAVQKARFASTNNQTDQNVA